MIKFLDVLGRYEAAEFSQLEAAELLGVGERTFRRWRQRYDEDGEAGLLDRRLGKASGKRVPLDREAEVEALYRTRYGGFTAKHFHELLVRDHKFAWGYTWTKTFLQSKGLLVKAKKRGAHRRKWSAPLEVIHPFCWSEDHFGWMKRWQRSVTNWKKSSPSSGRWMS
jgi:transposase